ncbi:MAG: MFS transporter [Rudaea sp.]|nr:MFS transporter [Rudaea sp.]
MNTNSDCTAVEPETAAAEAAQLAPAAGSASWADLLGTGNGMRVLALAGGTALHAINVYMVTTVMPSVVADIGGLDYYSWNTTLFVVASIVGAALAAALADAWGGKRAYLAGLATFSVGATLCALATAMPWLLLGRSVQGLGGGVLVSLAYVLIPRVLAERLWTRAMGLVSAMWGIATLAGPAIGGIFAQGGHWRLAFWMLLPVAAVLAVIVAVWLPASGRGSASARVPFAKLALLALSVLAISFASLAAQRGLQIAGVVAGLLLAAWILRIDRDAVVRLLPRSAFVDARLIALYATIGLLAMSFTVEIFLPYFLQVIHGHEPLAAGYLTAVMAAGWSFGSMTSAGRAKFAAQAIRNGPLLMAAGLFALAWILPHVQGFQAGAGFVVLLAALLAVGIGVGMAWPHLLARVLIVAPAADSSHASTAISTVQLYAMSLGAALSGLIANGAGLTSPGGVPGAQNAAAWLFGLFAVLVLAAALFARRAVR